MAAIRHGAIRSNDITPGIAKLDPGHGNFLVRAVAAQGIQRGGTDKDTHRSIVHVDKHGYNSGLRFSFRNSTADSCP